jgi:hypothetical protein
MSSNKIKKNCTQCGQLKDLDRFGKHSRSKDGLRAYCKDCQHAYDKSRSDRAKRGPSVQDMIDITIEKMKNDHTDVDVLEQLQKQLKKHIKNKKIENKATEENSFIMRNIANHKDSEDRVFVAAISPLFMSAQIDVFPDDVYVARKETEFLVQMDNVQMTPAQKNALLALLQ